MDVYGLTGGIGSGKTTVAELLEEYGVPVVSADELSRIVVARGSDGLADVVRSFGRDVLDDQGELDRRKMAAIVFRDPAKRRELEAILHPRIRERFEQVLDALEKAGHEVAVYEVPLLFEKNLQGEMQAVLLVTASEEVRARRVRARDDITQTEVLARMAAQMDEALKRKRADYIIENNGTMDDLRREVEFVLDRFLRVGSRHAASEAVTGPRPAAERPDREENRPRRVTEIPSGAGLPVDGRAPAFAGRGATAPAPAVAASSDTAPATEAEAAPTPPSSTGTAPGTAPVGSSATVPAARGNTMPAPAVGSAPAPPAPTSPTPTPSAPPGPASRVATRPAAPPELQPTLPRGDAPPPPDATPASRKRTEGVPDQDPSTRTTVGLPTGPPPEPAAPQPVPEEKTPPTGGLGDPTTARAGKPDVDGADAAGTGRPRRRKTMPASHFEKLRPQLPGTHRPAPPGPNQATVPNVPPPPTPGSAARSDPASPQSAPAGAVSGAAGRTDTPSRGVRVEPPPPPVPSGTKSED